MAEELFRSCFYVPVGQVYETYVKQINTQNLSSKMSTLPHDNQIQLFLLITEYCKQHDSNNYSKIIGSVNKKKLYLPYGLTTLKDNIHVQGPITNLPINLILTLDNYCRMVLEKK